MEPRIVSLRRWCPCKFTTVGHSFISPVGMAGKAPIYDSPNDALEVATKGLHRAFLLAREQDLERGLEGALNAMALFDMVDGYNEQKRRCRQLLAGCFGRKGCVEEARFFSSTIGRNLAPSTEAQMSLR